MNASPHPEVVICGAGIAGVATAYHLAVHGGVRGVVLVDERAPLSLTSDKSSECYRNWWPGPGDAMVALMERSIGWLERLAEKHGNRFGLNRRGYLYVTANPARLPTFVQAAEECAALGAGPLRRHAGLPSTDPYRPHAAEGWAGQPAGADLILNRGLIRQYFPYLSDEVVAVLHARHAGWFSGQQLGALLWEEARAYGARLLPGRVVGVETTGGRVATVQVERAGGMERLPARHFVNAAGPFVGAVARLLGEELPVFSELHLKLNFCDERGVVPRDAPLLIWNDPQHLAWSAEEREVLAEEAPGLLVELPPGAHLRPDGGAGSPIVLMLWPIHTPPVPETFPLPPDPLYPEVVLRGLCPLLPGLQVYLDRMPRPVVDGGYYTKTPENRPLIGPMGTEGAWVIGALSGFGLMAALGAGELLAAHLLGNPLPRYAPAFHPTRYQNPAYQQLLTSWGPSGQL